MNNLFIKFQDFQKNDIYVNPDHIIAVKTGTDEGTCSLWLANQQQNIIILGKAVDVVNRLGELVE